MLRKPNFFILGAPKCGTTTLTRWLAQHPSVFVPAIKEPNFFNTDDRRAITTLHEYESLFQAASDQHAAIGEASVWYLSSKDAVPNIDSYQPEARFIVMARNPVEMAPALHSEMLISGHESVRDFQTAWDLQGQRRGGKALPAFGWAQRRYLYGDVCSVGAQLEQLFALVSKSRVLVVFLDDLANNPRCEYLKILQFLGVADDGRVEFPSFNKSKTLRWPQLGRAAFFLAQIKRKMGIRYDLNLIRLIVNANTIETPRAPLAPQTAEMLRTYFARDVELLGRLTGRDLQSWLEPRDGVTTVAPSFWRDPQPAADFGMSAINLGNEPI